MVGELILGAIAVTIGLSAALIAYNTPVERAKRALRRARPTTVRDAVEGRIVKVVGRVRPVARTPLLVAPASGRRCAQFRLVVTQTQGKSKVNLVEDERAVDFIVEEESGRALVRMTAATTAVNMLDYNARDLGGDARARVEALLQRHGHPDVDLSAFGLSYSEGQIEEDETVSVCGLARFEPDPDPDPMAMGSYRESPRRLVIDVRPDGPVLVSDGKTTLK